MSNSYWINRVLANEANAERLAASLVKREKKLFVESYKRLSTA